MPTRAAIVIPGYSGVVLRKAAGNSPYPEDPYWPPASLDKAIVRNNIVWPPPVALVMDKVATTKRLADDDIVPVCPIWSYQVLFASLTFYGGAMPETLNDIVRSSGVRAENYMLGFGYDFRLDLRIAAKKLAEFVEYQCKDVDNVLIVAHSTGGLVARYMLECGGHSDRPWFKKIDHLVCLSVPHLGTATALGFAVGVGGSPIADAETVAEISRKDDRLCGLYQLFPHEGKSCAFDKTAAGEKSINIYTKEGAKELGLNWKGVQKAMAFRDDLAKGKKPKGVRYSTFHGNGKATPYRIVREGGVWSLDDEKTGDGTVTKASAIAVKGGETPHEIKFIEHAWLPTDPEVLTTLKRMYNRPLADPNLLSLADREVTTVLSMTAASSQRASGVDRFAICFPLILEHEGGYVDHPQDPGGATNLGITIGTLSRWLGRPATKADVRALTPASVAPIYRAYYWLPVKGSDMPAGVDYALFDYAVNSGVGRAVRHLQELLGVTVDGIIGAETMAEIGRQHPDFVVRALCERRLDFLKSLPTWPTFGRGWERRVQKVEDRALEMATGVPHGAHSGGTSASAPGRRRRTRPTPPPGP